MVPEPSESDKKKGAKAVPENQRVGTALWLDKKRDNSPNESDKERQLTNIFEIVILLALPDIETSKLRKLFDPLARVDGVDGKSRNVRNDPSDV